MAYKNSFTQWTKPFFIFILRLIYTRSISISFLKRLCISFSLLNFYIIYILQSGSQNDLCDSWTGEEGEESKAYTGDNIDHNNQVIPQRGDVANLVQLQYHQPKAAEYPFQSNLCMPPQGVNFDLTHKRGKNLYLILLYAISRVIRSQASLYIVLIKIL